MLGPSIIFGAACCSLQPRHGVVSALSYVLGMFAGGCANLR